MSDLARDLARDLAVDAMSEKPPASPRSPIRSILRFLVIVFTVACLGWVLLPIFRHAEELRASTDGPALFVGVVVAAVAYALLSVLLALAWWWLAGLYGMKVSFRRGYAVWARSQLGKYLPGNAFHFVSRQVMGREAGWSHAALVASSLLEMGSLLLAALLLALGGRVFVLPDAAEAHGASGAAGSWTVLLWVLLAGAACLLLWPLADRLLRRWPRTAQWLEGQPRLSWAGSLRLLGPSLLLHALFFLGTGSLLILLMALGWGDAGWGLPEDGAWTLVWVFPLAWAAGTVTVGAPAGVGVREAVMLVQLEPLLGPAKAAALVLALRLATTGGDLMTGALGWWVGRGRAREVD